MSKLKAFIQTLAKIAIVFIPLWFIAAAVGTKFGLWDWKFGFGKMVFAWGAPVMIGGLVVGVLALLAAFMKPRKAGGFILAAITLAIPLAGIAKAGATKKTAAALPFIHDISTDTADAPMFGSVIMAERSAMPGANSADYAGKTDGRKKQLVSELQAQGYPDIAPIKTTDAPALAYEKSLDAAKALGWTVKDARMADGVIEATDTTFWFGFKDDVIIRVRPEVRGSVIDVRSLSRVGGSDLGANADRVRAFRDKVTG